MQPRHKIDEDLQTDQFFVRQQRRLKYITENVNISKDEIWYDAGKVGGRCRTFLEQHYNNKPFTTPRHDLNYNLKGIKSDAFNVITHLEVIEHLMNPLLCMEECYRMLKPNGRLYLTTPNDYSLIYKLEHLLSRKYEPHFHQFSRSDLLWLLTTAGFKSVTVRTFKRSNTGYIARWCKNSFFVEAIK